MAVTPVATGTSPAWGIVYTHVTDSSADWAAVSNSTYFYDKADGLVHYKDSSGTVQEIFGGTDTNFANTDLTLTGARTHDLAGNTFTLDNGQTIIQGSGTTSATTSLLVENSSGTDYLKILDDGSFILGGGTITANQGKIYRTNFFIEDNTGTNTQFKIQSGQHTFYNPSGTEMVVFRQQSGVNHIEQKTGGTLQQNISSNGNNLRQTTITDNAGTEALKVVSRSGVGQGGLLVQTSAATQVLKTTEQSEIGFYTATPVARATTGISAATFVANTSGISDDTATWGGYTVGQVVQALQNIGILT